MPSDEMREKIARVIELDGDGLNYDVCAEDGTVLFTMDDFREVQRILSKEGGGEQEQGSDR